LTTSSSLTEKRKILVVEDDEDIRSLLHHVLRDGGYDVLCVDDGITALTALSEMSTDLILLDMAMPGMDGLTFLAQRANLPKCRDIPVICVTARDRNSDVKAAIELGADNYITKPFDNEILLACVARLLPAKTLRKDGDAMPARK